jgi:hypothetical protein
MKLDTPTEQMMHSVIGNVKSLGSIMQTSLVSDVDDPIAFFVSKLDSGGISLLFVFGYDLIHNTLIKGTDALR